MPLRLLIYHKKDNAEAFRRERAALLHALEPFGSLTLRFNGLEDSREEQLKVFRSHDAVILFHSSMPLPAELASDPGDLRLAGGPIGSMRAYVPRLLIEKGLALFNWGDAPAFGIAEGAFCLLLATLKNLHRQVRIIREDGWKMPLEDTGGSLRNLRLGIYGCGVIGRKFIDFVRPFQPRIRLFDPYLNDPPEGVERVHSLEELFENAQAIVIHAGLTDETRHSVTAGLLARLPRGGVIINTARGAIIDQDALFRELQNGRLRAGLDVLDPDWLPPGHPAKLWDNCLFTGHSVDRGWPRFGQPRDSLNEAESTVIDNLDRFQHGHPLRFRLSPEQYDRMT